MKRWNSPPGWPPPPPGWRPPAGWKPDPSWAPAPAGWKFWVKPPAHRRPVVWLPAAALVGLVGLGAVTTPPSAPAQPSSSIVQTSTPTGAPASTPSVAAAEKNAAEKNAAEKKAAEKKAAEKKAAEKKAVEKKVAEKKAAEKKAAEKKAAEKRAAKKKAAAEEAARKRAASERREQQESDSLPVVHPGAFCSGSGTGVTTAGTLMRCQVASDGRYRWKRA